MNEGMIVNLHLSGHFGQHVTKRSGSHWPAVAAVYDPIYESISVGIFCRYTHHIRGDRRRSFTEGMAREIGEG